ncbi:apolipo protein O-domain-containing protein [Syncephalis pseudoplumigaleata]|uniref:MICOS complex subunit n=1 Tax=Syncephalis pseudoplumigaleata TaxID=1712513 RepID=A0A4P9YYY4_9FUNG|nr:apolipo protein O-domain-containing protein [Syncephalis pseudoplumigaleata]|eukprot:RKP25326.1 apolipo protein O-domain-containing protein [Syncephalis pseudoplumigaleata]
MHPAVHAQERREKLGIYDEPVATHVDQTPQPSRLQLLLGEAREKATNISHDATTQSKQFVDKVIDAEKEVERTVRKVHARDEPMMPNLLYIGLAGLAGSILASRRSVLARIFFPPIAALGAAFYFMPKTTQSSLGLLRETADSPEVRDTVRRHVPAVLDSSDRARETVAQGVNQVGRLRQDIEQTVGSGVARARREIDGMEHRVRNSLGGVSGGISERASQLGEEARKQAEEARQQADHVSGWLRARGEQLPADEQLPAKNEALRERVAAGIDDAKQVVGDAVKQVQEQGREAADWVQTKVEEGREKLQQQRAEHSLRADESTRRPT